jgi:Cna protein B-type domain.
MATDRQDSGDDGIDGVTVTLYRADGTAVGSVTTTGGGSYSFSGLLPGEYYLEFSNLPAGYVFTFADTGSDASDSDANRTTGRTATFTLVSGQIDNTWDAGLYRPASVGNQVWLDTDGDGVQDSGELGVRGVTVQLSGTTGAGVTVSRSAITDDNGFYRFDDLAPGTYTVTVVAPAGFLITAADQGSNDAIDSDADPTTGAMSATVLESGEVDLTWDAGLYRPASIGDRVWRDTNGNGVQDAGEPGVANVEVRLSGTTGAGVAVSRTTTTNGSGLYRFDNLAPGIYTITVIAPAGDGFTVADQGGDDAQDSDADSGGVMPSTTLVSGEEDLSWDAGLFGVASIGNYVWEDTNGNGVQDVGEPGVEGVEVRLSGTTGAGVAVSLTTTTDSNGFYRFDDLAPGTYTVTVVPPTGYVLTAANQGSDDTVDSDADPNTGVMTATVLESGEVDLTWDAGLYRFASIGDLVWEDRNGNGVQETGEPEVAGVEVRLSGTTGAGATVNLTATTTITGFYRFDDLAPGTYTVTVVAPAGYVFTAANQGSNDAADSDARSEHGRYECDSARIRRD